MTDDTIVKAPAATAQAGAEYVILQRCRDDSWSEVGRETARSAEAAIRAMLASVTADETEATYVAVPARSWRPITVRAETVTTLKLEEVT